MNSDFQPMVDKFEHYMDEYVGAFYTKEPLGEVLQYAMQGKGKRIRPLFCLLAARALGGDEEIAMAPALAVEMVHTYSLVHDDLPCMDDDDTRRGRATTHKKFGEDWGLLAGDGLLTDAFAVLTDHVDRRVSMRNRLMMVAELATAAGSQGMVRGQGLDIHWTGKAEPGKAELDEIHVLKTGRLIGAACGLGALAAGGSKSEYMMMREFGRVVGLAFQIRDDIIDGLEGTGKSAGKDQESGKLTYMSMMTQSEAEAAADNLTNRAIDLVGRMGQNGNLLKKLATLLLTRTK